MKRFRLTDQRRETIRLSMDHRWGAKGASVSGGRSRFWLERLGPVQTSFHVISKGQCAPYLAKSSQALSRVSQRRATERCICVRVRVRVHTWVRLQVRGL